MKLVKEEHSLDSTNKGRSKEGRRQESEEREGRENRGEKVKLLFFSFLL